VGTFSKRNTDTTNANAKRSELADKFAMEIYTMLVDDIQYDLNNENLLLNFYQFAKRLNEKGIKTRTGGSWTLNSMKNVLKRVKDRNLLERD